MGCIGLVRRSNDHCRQMSGFGKFVPGCRKHLAGASEASSAHSPRSLFRNFHSTTSSPEYHRYLILDACPKNQLLGSIIEIHDHMVSRSILLTYRRIPEDYSCTLYPCPAAVYLIPSSFLRMPDPALEQEPSLKSSWKLQ